MNSLLSMKALRFLLSLSVSLWMAGGCLFGCSSSAMGSELHNDADDSVQAVVAGESCHEVRSHECCSNQKPKSQKPKKRIATSSEQLNPLPSLVPTPRGMMKDCPLVVNATAATSKNSSPAPEPGRGSIAGSPLIENRSEQSEMYLVV